MGGHCGVAWWFGESKNGQRVGRSRDLADTKVARRQRPRGRGAQRQRGPEGGQLRGSVFREKHRNSHAAREDALTAQKAGMDHLENSDC